MFQVDKLHSLFTQFHEELHPVEEDIVQYEAFLDRGQPFGLKIDEGKEARDSVTAVLQKVEETSDKLEKMETISNEIVEELEKYDIRAKPVLSQVTLTKKRMNELKDELEERKENIESEIKDLEEFVTDSEKEKKWTENLQKDVKEMEPVSEEPEIVRKQLEDVEVGNFNVEEPLLLNYEVPCF